MEETCSLSREANDIKHLQNKTENNKKTSLLNAKNISKVRANLAYLKTVLDGKIDKNEFVKLAKTVEILEKNTPKIIVGGKKYFPSEAPSIIYWKGKGTIVPDSANVK